MSATGNPSSSSLPPRYSRVRAWHRVGLTLQTVDAATISWPGEPAAFATPDGGEVIVFSSLQLGSPASGVHRRLHHTTAARGWRHRDLPGPAAYGQAVLDTMDAAGAH